MSAFLRGARIRAVGVALLCGVLVGCATYEPPKDGDTATIAFTGGARYAYIDTASHAGRSCSAVPQARGENWQNQILPAGRQVWIRQGIDTTGLAYGVSCGFTYSFIPEKGAEYVAEYSFDMKRCSLHLSQQLSSGARVAVPTYKRESGYCW